MFAIWRSLKPPTPMAYVELSITMLENEFHKTYVDTMVGDAIFVMFVIITSLSESVKTWLIEYPSKPFVDISKMLQHNISLFYY